MLKEVRYANDGKTAFVIRNPLSLSDGRRLARTTGARSTGGRLGRECLGKDAQSCGFDKPALWTKLLNLDMRSSLRYLCLSVEIAHVERVFHI